MASVLDVPDRVLTFEWQIKNFSYISKKEDVVESPVFKSNSGSWIVSIGLGIVYIGAKCLSVSLGKEDLVDDQNSIFDWEYSFLDVRETPLFTKPVPKHNFVPRIEGRTAWSDTTGPSWEEVFVTNRSEYLPEDTLTLRLRLWQSEIERPAENEYCSTTTVLELDKVCIFWNIERFSSFRLSDMETKSLYFTTFGNTCCISFSLEGSELQASKVSLKMLSDKINFNVSCKISVLDVNKMPEKILDVNYKFNDSLIWCLSLFLTRRDILEGKKHYLNNDVLSLVLEFENLISPYLGTIFFRPADLKKSIPNFPTLSEANHQTSQKTGTHSNSPQPKENTVMSLEKDFLSLFQERKLCDFEIRCKDTLFPVHKAVLSARSPFFSNMFSSDMKEEDSSLHYDSDLDGKTINIMLAFLYSDTLEPELTWKDARKLYVAAVKYQVQSLKKQCASILKSSISMLNVLDLLMFADKHGDDELKILGEAFLFENLDEIMVSPKWREFHERNTELGIIIMKNFFGPTPKKQRLSISSRAEGKRGSSSHNESR